MPMGVTDDDFAGFESAELMHARGLPTPMAEQICARYLERGTWKRAPQAWTMLAERSTRREDATRDRLGWFEAWVEAVSQDAVEQAHDDVLRYAIGWGLLDRTANAEDRARVAGKLVRWLCAHAGPGAAGCCASLLSRVYLRTRPHSEGSEAKLMDARIFAQEFTPLARHLVEVGVAELRSSSHHDLTAHIVAALEREGPPSLLVAAFEIMIAAGHDLQVWWDLERPDELWWLSEAALAAGLSPSRCWDIVTRVQLRDFRRVWAPLLFVSFPHCAKALMSGLASAGIPSETARAGWPAMVLMNEPPQLEEPLTQHAALLLAEVLQRDILPGLNNHLVRGYLDSERPDRKRIARWVVFVAETLLEMAGPPCAHESRRFAARHLSGLVSWASNLEDVALNHHIASSLRKWIDAAESDDRALSLATRILRDNQNPSIAAMAAIECLSNAPADGVVPAGVAWLSNLRVEFERFVALPWNERVFGIDMHAVLAGVTKLVFDEGTSEQVTVNGSTMHLRPDYYGEVFRRCGATDEARALCMLYFIHELLHIPQGIGAFDTVQRLRAVGAELTLMHLDLTADHAAMLLVHRAVPRWSVTWLERLVSSSLESFPASSFHTQAARHRKAVRLLSTRADLLVREREPRAPEGMGYLFVDYAPGGGGLFLLAYGPPQRVLARVEISADESRLLNDAAAPRENAADGFAKIDVVLERLLAAWKSSK